MQSRPPDLGVSFHRTLNSAKTTHITRKRVVSFSKLSLKKQQLYILLLLLLFISSNQNYLQFGRVVESSLITQLHYVSAFVRKTKA